MELICKTIIENSESTASALYHKDGEKLHFLAFTIEDEYREVKVPGDTRIPAGRYRLLKKTDGQFFLKYKAAYGHKFVLEISGVPNFKSILFHIGNYTRDTRGCLLICSLIGYQGDRFYGSVSATAYKSFYNYMEKHWDDNVWLEVVR